LEDARALLVEDDVGVDEVVSALQTQKEEQRKLNERLSVLAAESDKERSSLMRKSEQLAIAEQRLKAEQQAELAKELAAAKQQIAELVKQAQQPGAAGREQLKQAQRASQGLARLTENASGKANEAASGGAGAVVEVDRESIAVGDRVMVPRLGGAPVEVEERRGNQLSVVFGGLKMKVKLKEVAKVLPAEAKAPAKVAAPVSAGRKAAGGKRAAAGAKGGAAKGAPGRTRAAVRVETNTLDIRGMRPSEIEADLGRAIDRALGLGTLFVIHGHGTGSLRKAVRELLSEDPAVASFEDAPQYEGGSGCTIAYLR